MKTFKHRAYLIYDKTVGQRIIKEVSVVGTYKARIYIAPHPALSVLLFCHQTIYLQGGDIASHGFL